MDKISWIVNIPTYKEVEVLSDSWRHSIKEAALKLHIITEAEYKSVNGGFRMREIRESASSHRKNPRVSGRKKEFPS